MGMYKRYHIGPVITKKTLKDYKHDEFYLKQCAYINRCKALSSNDMELKHLIAYVEKAVDLIFFSKHNPCEIYYDQEDMIDDVLKPLENYVEARYINKNDEKSD